MPSQPPSPFSVASAPFGSAWIGDPRSQPLLQGLTVLAVEDSRFACEALRLMCRRVGARLRRAETLDAARAHLRVYRPDVVIIDLGLPDGRGESLIRDLVLGSRRPPVILGTSGNLAGRALALAAGADEFLDKPLESLTALCRALRPHLPELDADWPQIRDDRVNPDPLALRDDLQHAAAVLAQRPDPARQRYVSGFLSGVARHADDAALAAAAAEAGQDQDPGLEGLRQLVDCRLAVPLDQFSLKPD